jgi:Rod binding domain-containing protein
MAALAPPSLPVAPGAATPAVPSLPSDPAKLRQAARDFEAMAIGALLQPMFDTIDTAHAKFGGGAAEAAWKPMLVQEMAKQIAAHGGLGLADQVYAAMLRMQEEKAR